MLQSKKYILPAISLIISLLLSIWYGIIIPELLKDGTLNYIISGIYGTILMGGASLMIYLDFSPAKWLLPSIHILHAICVVLVVLSFMPASLVVWLTILISAMQAAIIGGLVNQYYNSLAFDKNIPYLMLGTLGAFLTEIIPFKLRAAMPVDAKNGNTLADPSLMISLLIFFLLIVLILSAFWNTPAKSVAKAEKPLVFRYPRLLTFSIISIVILMPILEMLFYYWSVLLQNEAQSWTGRIVFPAAIIIIFILRKMLPEGYKKINNFGWLFVLTIMLTWSLGLFYTFTLSPVFIVFFSVSIAYMPAIIHHVYGFHFTRGWLAVLFIIGAVGMLITGLYVENHMDFIKAIKLPDDVLTLSARQALVKELATFAAISVIISGYLFLKRRTFIVS